MSAKTISVSIPAPVALDRILFATDLSDISLSALPLVSTIAHKYHSQVLLTHIWTPLPSTMATPKTSSGLQRMQEQDAECAAETLLANRYLAGLPVKLVVECGEPAEEINRVAREQDIDLVVVTTHGRTGFRHLLMGSVAEELFRSLPCPVLTVGPNISKSLLEQNEIGEILFPTDLSDQSCTVFPYLNSLASEYRAALTLLHVLPVETATNPDARLLAEPLRKQMQNMFASSIDPRCKAKFQIDFGDTVERILDQAKNRNADLIGLGVRKMAEITTHFRNTVAYRIILQSNCPVLTTSSE
jgi:nucleotide-binding universal stress UspA family protein